VPQLVADINPQGASSDPTELTQVGNTLFFVADDGVHGAELWKSDGTAAGTVMVKDIRPGPNSSWPENLVNVNGTLFFMASDGKHGNELWKSDGTKAGTVMVKDLHPGPNGQFGGNSTSLLGPPIVVGSRLFLVAETGDFGDTLYVSDGTMGGTYAVELENKFTSPDGAFEGTAGGKFYFVTLDADGGAWDIAHLWVSDGTSAGTQAQAGAPTAENMSILPVNGTNLYFFTDRLWRTNGTEAGTFALTDVGLPSGSPNESALMNSHLYFNGGGLWKTNGSGAGTNMISGGEAKWLAVAGSLVFFTRGSHLWRSDGTAAGTIDMGAFGPQQPRMTVGVGNMVCFVEADWGNATWTLWRSDGTIAGTYQVAAFVILGGGFSTGDGPIGTVVGSTLFFSAADGVHGAELWSYTP
jgi:ELWxxDGT repeat protein